MRFDLNTCKVLDDVTSDGGLFHFLLRVTLPAKFGRQSCVEGQPVLRSKMNAVVNVSNVDRGFEQWAVESQPDKPARMHNTIQDME